MSHHEHVSTILQEHGLSQTKHRQMVLDILGHAERFLTADQLYMEIVKQDETVSLSTIYRIVDVFTQKGILHKVMLEGSNQAYYELAHAHHCHHLICTQCHQVIHIEGCPIQNYERQIASDYGFIIQEHRLEIYGICSDCQTK